MKKKVIAINTTVNPVAAQDRIIRGVNFLADAVKLTLGPHGKNFLLEKGLKVTNDGITIAKEIESRDEIENLGVRTAREALVKTNDQAGDGTTTAITLCQAVLKEAVRLLPTKDVAGKMSAMAVRRKIHQELVEVLEKLKASATPVKTREELIEVAKVSVEDDGMAKLIGDAQWDVGPNGTLIAEDSNDLVCSVEKINGVRLDNGFGTSFIVNNQEKQRMEAENVAVIMTNYTFDDFSKLKIVLDSLIKSGRKNIAVIARAFTANAIQICMKNIQSGINIYPINAPYVNQREVMLDLEAVLGGTYYDTEQRALEDLTVADVGTAKKIIAYRFSAIITGEQNELATTRIQNRIALLKKTHDGEPSQFLKKTINARISQLENGFSLVKIGSVSDTDRKYRYDKAEDAVNAVRAALEEGTVKGAGLALKEIADALPDGYILKRALCAPYNQIMDNAGEVFAVEPWVRNAVKVERIALENACHIAADIATAGGAIAYEFPRPRLVQEVEKDESEE